MSDRSIAKPSHHHFFVLALYTVLTLVLTWPLVTHLTTHVPGVAQWAFDESTFLWNIWYFKHSLVDHLQSPLHSELIWYPLGIDLVLYTYNFFHALVAQPLMLAVNLPFASNIALLLSTILSGYRGEGIEAYRVAQPPGDDSFSIDLGVAGPYPYRGEGWDASEVDNQYDTTTIWATAPESRLFVPLRQIDENATYTLRARIHPYAYPGSPPQTVQASVNGWQGEVHLLNDGWQEVTWSIPGSVLTDTLDHVDLHWGWTAQPRVVMGGNRQIGSTGVELPIDAELNGFAKGGFIALFDETGDQIDASAGRLGVNVTVLDGDGNLGDKVGFDTTANRYESDALAAYLDKIAAGQLVLVVSKGAATTHLTEAAVNGLRTLGAEVTVDSLQGQHFAIIAIQGAPHSSAALTLDSNTAYLRISLDRDRRMLAAAVDWVEIR